MFCRYPSTADRRFGGKYGEQPRRGGGSFAAPLSAVPPVSPIVTTTFTNALVAVDAVATRTVCAPPSSLTPVIATGGDCVSLKLKLIVGNGVYATTIAEPPPPPIRPTPTPQPATASANELWPSFSPIPRGRACCPPQYLQAQNIAPADRSAIPAIRKGCPSQMTYLGPHRFPAHDALVEATV